jgi:hypothetical protein
MEDWLWTGLKIAALLAVFALLAFIWEKIRNAVSARVGIGRYYNHLPKSGDTQRLITNINMLGDYLQSRSTEHMRLDPPADWEWRLGDDLKRIAELARISTVRGGAAF